MNSPEYKYIPELKEYNGLKYEYLVLDLYDRKVNGLKKGGGFLSSGEEKTPLALHYNNQFKKIKDEQGETVSFTQQLNILGTDGWRLVGAVNRGRSEGTGYPMIFFERNVNPEKNE